jgi:hypothetical protein
VSRTCTVCRHERLDDVDRALISGVPHVALSKRYGLSVFALSRHAKAHLPETLALAHDAAEVSRADDLLNLILEQRDTARRVAKKAEKAGQGRTVLAAVQQLLKVCELEAKLAGQLKDGPTINVILSPEWVQVRAVILSTLAAYPEARAVVSGRLLELEAGDQ